jgi:hypothetical protein
MCLIVQESKLPEPTHGLPSLVGAVKPSWLSVIPTGWSLSASLPTRLMGHEISLCSQAYLDNGRSREHLRVLSSRAAVSARVCQ